MRCRIDQGILAVLWPAVLALTALGLPGPVQADSPVTTQPVATPSPVRVVSGWLRWLPGNLPAGGYLTLRNDGAAPIALLGATSPDYAQISLHRSVESAGTTRMLPVQRVQIAPHSTLEFAATGYHLMLMSPKVTLRPGERVPLTLSFDGAPPLTTSLEVRKPDGSRADAPAGAGQMPGMPNMNM